VIAFLLSHSLGDVLFGIEAFDPVAYLAVAATMLGIGILAGLIPAMNAARVDPMIALRHE
jgi:ABC-type antimicrobial peptide transport system permease subunit